LDHRTDIFSFGAILYELLSGRKAFKKDNASDTIAAVLREEPPELTTAGRNVSPALDHIVRHCLEKDRESRFQTAKDVAFALSEASSPTTTVTSGVQIVREPPARKWKPLAIAGIALVVLAAAGLLLWKRPRAGATAASAGIKRIAVLPFENLGAPSDDYFADGIADQVRGKLTGIPGIEVIARGSSTPYKKTTKTPQEIAKELSANYLLTATVRWQKDGGANRVQVNPELVEIKAEGPPASKWQQPFDAALTDVFQVQSDIASRVAQSLGVALAPKEEKALAERPTDNIAAYDAFLKGEEAASSLGRTDPASLRRALTFYEQAVSLDPRFAQAWAQISIANTLLYSNSVPDRALDARAREAAEKAVELAPQRGEGYGALAAYFRLAAAEPARALEQYDKAIQLAPGSIDLLRGRGAAEASLGRWDDALRDMREAARRDPRSIPNASTLSDTLFRMGRRDEARPMLRHLVEIDPKNLSRLERYAMLDLADGDLEGARRVVAEGAGRIGLPEIVAYFAAYYDLGWVLDGKQLEVLRTLTPAAFDDDPATWAVVQAQAAALRGDTAGARESAGKAVAAFDRQLGESPNDAQLHALRGLALAYAGRRDEALREAERGMTLRGPDKDAVNGPYFVYTLARVHTLNGETDKAIETLERLVRLPNYVTAGWVRIDPNFSALRGDPRFQKLVASAK
jgi:eukaryotic-like serine/threonine-protein kinase